MTILDPPWPYIPLAAIIGLYATGVLLARDADDRRGHRRGWLAVGLAAVLVLVGWVAIYYLAG